MRVFLIANVLPLCAFASGLYGGLAIVEEGGTFYGWSHSYASLNEVDAQALKECDKIGWECRVVLGFTGTSRCAAYRAVENDVGTAYGWGVREARRRKTVLRYQNVVAGHKVRYVLGKYGRATLRQKALFLCVRRGKD